MSLPDKFGSMTSEERIQYVFNTLNTNSEEYRSDVASLLMNDPSPVVRHEAAYIFGEIEDRSCSEFLINAIQNDNNRFVVHEALLALSNRGEAKTKFIIKKQINNSDSDIADTAQISLERLEMKLNDHKITLEEASEYLLDLNRKMEERIQSSFILMEEGSINSLNILIKAYHQEPNAIVKHEIIFSLGESASQKAAEILATGILNDVNDFVIHETLLALSTLGFKNYCSIIQEFVNHPSLEVSESAEIALERLNCNVQ
ncbi:MAG: HEAT repeat domain-containing protein [Candidatus Heimdallarchaeota archaeon]|nr:HEAT repeat domain-containing protein [Candidatus Heimdallarchaeota archaeon]